MIALSGIPALRTERLTLRAPQGDDWPAWRAFYLSDRAVFVRPPDQPPTEEAAWRSLGHFIGHWPMRGYGSYVIQRHDDPTPLGAVGPWYPAGKPEREIGWTLWSAEAEGRGYATEAARATVAHAFETLGWDTAVSYIHAENRASARVAERLGATLDPDAGRPDPDDRVYRHPAP